MKYEQEILKAQFSQEFHVNSQIAGTDEHDFLKSMYDNLYSCYDKEGFEKSWSSDLAKRFPNGGWRTVNGSRVFINGGKVVAGLGGFNGMIDDYFSAKKESENKSKEEIGSENLKRIKNKLKEEYKLSNKGINEFLRLGSVIKASIASKQGEFAQIHNFSDKNTIDELVSKELISNEDGRIKLTTIGQKASDEYFNESKEQSLKEEKKGGLSSVEQNLFNHAKKRYNEISEQRAIEIRDKIVQVDKGKTSNINALAEALMYSDGENHAEDYFGDAKEEAEMAQRAIDGESGYENAQRIVDLKIGGSLEAKAKELIGQYELIKNKVSQLGLDPSSKQVLKRALSFSEQEMTLNKTIELLNKIKGGNLVDVVEAIRNNFNNESQPNPVNIDTFKEIAKKAKDPKDFIEQTKKITNVPPEVAKEFYEKYADGGKLSQEQSVKKFMEEVNKKEKEETRQEFFELPDIKDQKGLDKNISKILSQYSGRKMAAIQVESYLAENKELGKEWIKDKGIANREGLEKYLAGRQGKDRKEVVGQKKESAKEWEKTKVELRVNDIFNLALQQEKQMQDKIKESDNKQSEEKIPVSKDGLYQIYTINVRKNDGSVEKMYAVPSSLNKGVKGFGDDLLHTLDQAIKTAEYNRHEEKVIRERKAEQQRQKEKEEEENRARKERNAGKTKLEIMNEAKDSKILDTKMNYGGQIMTRKEHAEAVIRDGGRVETKEVNKVKDVSRSAYNRMDGRQQAELERRIREGGKKTEYRLYTKGDSFYTVTKAEYDYAKQIQDKLK